MQQHDEIIHKKAYSAKYHLERVNDHFNKQREKGAEEEEVRIKNLMEKF